MTADLLKITATSSILLACTLIAIAHYRRPDLPASETPLSIYFTTPTRSIMNSAYATISTSLAFTALIIGKSMHYASLAAALACYVGALSLIPVAATTQRNAVVIRSDATRRAHRYAAATAFASIGMAMTLSAIDAIIATNITVLIISSLGSVLAGRALLSKPGPTHGLRQKLFLSALAFWVIAVAITG